MLQYTSPSDGHARRFELAGVLALAFIVYGSLYPFAFHGGTAVSALATFWQHRHESDQPPSGLVANIVLYLPLGLFWATALGRWRGLTCAVVFVTLGGTLLSTTMELAQYFDATRVSSLADVYANAIGAFGGGVLAGPFTRWRDYPLNLRSPARQSAALLLLAYLGWRLFPYVPTLDVHSYWHAIRPVVDHPHLRIAAVASDAVLWAVVGALLAELAGRAMSRTLLVIAMAGVLAARVGIVDGHWGASELAALPVAILIWQWLSRLGRQRAAIGLAALTVPVVIAERLLPFDWQSSGHGFGWIPFHSIMVGSTATNTKALAEKLFLYGSLIWLLVAAGLRHRTAGGAVAAGLFITSLLETHLPGRSAEITDAVLALGMAATLASMAGAWRIRTPAAMSAARPGSAAEDIEQTAGDQ